MGDVDNGYVYMPRVVGYGKSLYLSLSFALNLKPKYFILKQKENVLSSHLAVLKEDLNSQD